MYTKYRKDTIIEDLKFKNNLISLKLYIFREFIMH